MKSPKSAGILAMIVVIALVLLWRRQPVAAPVTPSGPARVSAPAVPVAVPVVPQATSWQTSPGSKPEWPSAASESRTTVAGGPVPSVASSTGAPATGAGSETFSGNSSIAEKSLPEVKASVDDAVRLIDAGDYRTVFRTYALPAIGQSPADEAGFLRRMSDLQSRHELENIFHQMQGLTPDLNTDGTRATYHMPGPNGEWPYVFVKIDGKWYSEN